MGKLPPAMRSAKLPLAFLKPPPSPSPSASASPSPPPPKPHRPPLLKNPLKKKKKPPTQTPSPLAPPSPPPIFQSRVLSDAVATFDSLSVATAEAGASLDPATLLRSFCDTGASPSDAFSLFRHISSHLPPDRPCFHVLLGHSCLQAACGDNDDRLTPVFNLLDLMSSSGFPPDAASADLAVRALCSAARLDDACALLRRLCSFSSPGAVLPDVFTYNFLIRRLARSHPISSVYAFIDELRRSSGIRPDLVTYTILIDAVCRGRNLREATRLLGVLADAGFKPDCYLYNTIMKGYCMVDQCGEVMEVYNKMKDEGVEPDLVTYNTLVYGLSKAGMVDQAKRFLNVMASMGHFPDTVTYTSLMNGMCRKGDALGALRLLGEMEEKGCSPNECTYNTLLMGLCKAKCLEKGMELYGVMKAGGMKLENAAYATFVRVLCRANKIAEAYEVFDYVLESKSLTDVSAYLALESSLKFLQKAKA
ncbi:Pentatricopeptide repeat-containing protein [Cocos nucifera]|uniref:Pentatricopeptide repeat-containing protein n=1 Tax=Cocos nucifera TaxID=13894 RepID=A0A8K0ILF1_COCNU|nr:Pentatricopeptide repeat-containing protein [Cocos nucifera]